MPKPKTDGAMKSTSPCNKTSSGEIRDFLFITLHLWSFSHFCAGQSNARSMIIFYLILNIKISYYVYSMDIRCPIVRLI